LFCPAEAVVADECVDTELVDDVIRCSPPALQVLLPSSPAELGCGTLEMTVTPAGMRGHSGRCAKRMWLMRATEPLSARDVSVIAQTGWRSSMSI